MAEIRKEFYDACNLTKKVLEPVKNPDTRVHCVHGYDNIQWPCVIKCARATRNAGIQEGLSAAAELIGLENSFYSEMAKSIIEKRVGEIKSDTNVGPERPKGVFYVQNL